MTVVLAIVGPENGSTLAAFIVAPSNAVGSVPTRSSSWVLLDLSDAARNAAVASATGVRGRCVLEEYRGVGDVSVVGCVGSLIVATRGVVGPGEVLLTVRGSKEAYLAWSDQPLPRGTEVLVIDIRGARTVLVEPWTL